MDLCKMAQADTASARWKCVSLIFGILTLFRESKTKAIEVTLAARPEPVVENSPLTLTYTYMGTQTVDAFGMIINENWVGLLVSDANCSVYTQPNKTLYDYKCLTNTEFQWTIKKVTRANEGDILEFIVYYSGGFVTANYTISVYGINNVETDNATIIVGVTLGVFSFVVVVYATVVTTLWRRKTAMKDTKSSEKSTSQACHMYVNSGFGSDVTVAQGCIYSVNTRGTEEDTLSSDNQYTSLDPFRKDDAAYEVIQRH